MIWLALMPFTLWKTCHWAIIPVSAVIAFLLLGIEEIGVQIEEPFGILPLGICRLSVWIENVHISALLMH